MRHLWSRIVTVLLSCCAGSDGADPWYETLSPPITRSEIHQKAGVPSTSDGSQDRYSLGQGYIIVQYVGDRVVDCTYFDPPGGGFSRSLYATFGDPLTAAQMAQRQAYLDAKEFALVPAFPGRHVLASGEAGICYPIDHRWVVVEKIVPLLGGMGFFVDKVARVTVIDASTKQRTVLYRAIDHWDALRPPYLSVATAEAREEKLRALGKDLTPSSIAMALGEPDSHMGSGVDYQLYYLRHGLLVNCNPHGTEPWVSLPGETSLSLRSWLGK